MTLIDRVRARAETDLLDGELTAMITDAQQAIQEKFGPDVDDDDPIVVTFTGFRRTLDLLRPLDEERMDEVTITEYTQSFIGGEGTVLTTDDYTVMNGGRTLQRVSEFGRHVRWGSTVSVSYFPVNDQAQRDEVTVKLVILAIQYDGVGSSKVGDSSITNKDYVAEREKLLGSLDQRGGLGMA